MWRRAYNLGFEALKWDPNRSDKIRVWATYTWYTGIQGSLSVQSESADHLCFAVEYPSPSPVVPIIDARRDKRRPAEGDNVVEMRFPDLDPGQVDPEQRIDGSFGYEACLYAGRPVFDARMYVTSGEFDYLVPVINLGWIEKPRIPRFMYVQGDRSYDSFQKDICSGPRWKDPAGNDYWPDPDQGYAVFYDRQGDTISGYAWIWRIGARPIVHAGRFFPQPMRYSQKDEVGIPGWAWPADPALPGTYYYCCLQQEFHATEFSCRGINDPNLFVVPDWNGRAPWIRYFFFEDELLGSDEEIPGLVEPYVSDLPDP
jgi:hypothetical protein